MPQHIKITLVFYNTFLQKGIVMPYGTLILISLFHIQKWKESIKQIVNDWDKIRNWNN